MMTKTIFIASTQSDIKEISSRFITRIEGEGFYFETGEGLVEKIKREKPTLIVLDKDIPAVSGDEICYIIKNDLELRKIPIMILISNDKTETLERCLLSGCDDYMLKPANEHDFSTKLARLLQLSHRKEMRILARMWLKGRKLSKYFFGSIKDLSLSGMLFSTDVKLEKDEIIEITFFLPVSTRKISVTCKVVRVEQTEPATEYQFGIQFLNMEEMSHLLLKDYLDKLVDNI